MAPMLELYQKIRFLREQLNMSQDELAKKTGYTSRTSIAKIEAGKIDLPQSKIALFANALNTTVAQLMGWETQPVPSLNPYLIKNINLVPQTYKVPRLGTIACGKPILAVEEAEKVDDVPENISCDFTLQCKGDSMINARIYDGDIVYIKCQPEVENGEIAAVRIGDEATLKKVYYNKNRVILRACNPLYEDLEYEGDALNEIQILGKAIAFTSLIK